MPMCVYSSGKSLKRLSKLSLPYKSLWVMHYFTNNIILLLEAIIIQNAKFFVVFCALSYFAPLIIGFWQTSKLGWKRDSFTFDKSGINCTCSFTFRKRISRLASLARALKSERMCLFHFTPSDRCFVGLRVIVRLRDLGLQGECPPWGVFQILHIVKHKSPVIYYVAEAKMYAIVYNKSWDRRNYV